jgi:hypothetical protein
MIGDVLQRVARFQKKCTGSKRRPVSVFSSGWLKRHAPAA